MASPVIITGGSAAFPIRDFLTCADGAFVYREDEGPAGIAVCTFADGPASNLPLPSRWPSALVSGGDAPNAGIIGIVPAFERSAGFLVEDSATPGRET